MAEPTSRCMHSWSVVSELCTGDVPQRPVIATWVVSETPRLWTSPAQ